jgi:hypothetical protein
MTYVEHVLHVVRGDEGVIDGHDLDVGVEASRPADQSADSSKPVNSNFDRPARITLVTHS